MNTRPFYDPPAEFWDVEAEVAVIDLLSFQDIAPVLTDLNERMITVRGRRTNFRPPMAGDPDVGVQLLFVAMAVLALRKVVELLAEDLYKGVRAGLLALIRKLNERDQGRPWSLDITVGSHHFYFMDLVGESEFNRALEAMQPIIQASPDGLLDRTLEPWAESGSGWYWRTDSGLWVPSRGMEAAMRGVFDDPTTQA